MENIKPELTNPDLVRLNFFAKHEYEKINAPCNLVIEVRRFDPSMTQSLKSVAWTIFSLFDPAGEP